MSGRMRAARSHSRLLSPRIRVFIDWAVPRLRERLIAVDARSFGAAPS